ncbi:hypothetical protein CBL_14545 [Carabus blaptoides fortunei]
MDDGQVVDRLVKSIDGISNNRAPIRTRPGRHDSSKRSQVGGPRTNPDESVQSVMEMVEAEEITVLVDGYEKKWERSAGVLPPWCRRWTDVTDMTAVLSRLVPLQVHKCSCRISVSPIPSLSSLLGSNPN